MRKWIAFSVYKLSRIFFSTLSNFHFNIYTLFLHTATFNVRHFTSLCFYSVYMHRAFDLVGRVIWFVAIVLRYHFIRLWILNVHSSSGHFRYECGKRHNALTHTHRKNCPPILSYHRAKLHVTDFTRICCNCIKHYCSSK